MEIHNEGILIVKIINDGIHVVETNNKDSLIDDLHNKIPALWTST